jgi:hypothetical protein
MKQSSRSRAVTVTVVAIWATAAAVTITDGVEAEAIITPGVITITTTGD